MMIWGSRFSATRVDHAHHMADKSIHHIGIGGIGHRPNSIRQVFDLPRQGPEPAKHHARSRRFPRARHRHRATPACSPRHGPCHPLHADACRAHDAMPDCAMAKLLPRPSNTKAKAVVRNVDIGRIVDFLFLRNAHSLQKMCLPPPAVRHRRGTRSCDQSQDTHNRLAPTRLCPSLSIRSPLIAVAPNSSNRRKTSSAAASSTIGWPI